VSRSSEAGNGRKGISFWTKIFGANFVKLSSEMMSP
jgi:hypothetical protein